MQWLDPKLTAYLDWRLLLRDLVAVALPGLPSASSDSLRHLKESMQQAASNAEGSLTQDELLSVDMASVVSRVTTDSAAAGAAEPAGSADEDQLDSTRDAAPQEDAENNSDDQGQSPAGSSEGHLQGTDTQTNGASFGGSEPAEIGETQCDPAVSFKSLLCQVFFGGSIAAVDIDDLMLYLSCHADGTAGLQKAFEVLLGGSEGSQVAQSSAQTLACCCAKHLSKVVCVMSAGN